MPTLQLVDLKRTRNLSIIGIAILLGLVIPAHFDKSPVHFGMCTVESLRVLNSHSRE